MKWREIYVSLLVSKAFSRLAVIIIGDAKVWFRSTPASFRDALSSPRVFFSCQRYLTTEAYAT